MYIKKIERPIVATLANGQRFFQSDLPQSNIKRWVMRNKMAVVNGIIHDLIGFDEACEKYDISSEEMLSWMKLVKTHGGEALKATRLMKYRQPLVE